MADTYVVTTHYMQREKDWEFICGDDLHWKENLLKKPANGVEGVRPM